MGKDYSDWDKEDLIEEVKRLKKRKTFGIVWEDQREEVAVRCEKELPVLREVKKLEIKSAPDAVTNFMIEGDNYHVLSVLNYTHSKKVDVIYIDPPYNTGSKKWKYNNNYIDKDDSYKHSKWLSFMSKRLKLARNLLKEDGIIVVTIDDYEIANLTLLMNEIFGENNRLGTVTIMHKPEGRRDKNHFAPAHEYALFYAYNKGLCKTWGLPLTEEEKVKYNREDEISFYQRKNFVRTGSNSNPKDGPGLFYPIFWNEEKKTLSLDKKKGNQWEEIWPKDSKGQDRVWRWGKDRVEQEWMTELEVIPKQGGKTSIFTKQRLFKGDLKKPITVWRDAKYNATSHGTKLLQKLFGGVAGVFDYPKSIYAVLDTLQICSKDKKDAVILDFFAGSGTTGHATALLNKIDGGNRQFILCTNDENNIAGGVCYPRMRAIMGKNDDIVNNLMELKFNLKYMDTDFVPAQYTNANKYKLTEKATEMLCLKESAFEKVKGNECYKIFKNNEKHVGIIFDENFIEEFKESVENIKDEIIVYVFSLSDYNFSEEFKDMNNIKSYPIPEAILNVYRKIFMKRG